MPRESPYQCLIEAIADVGRGLAAFLDVVKQLKNLAQAGLSGYEYVLAERARRGLKDTSRRSSMMMEEQQAQLVDSIDQYISNRSRPEALLMQDWTSVRNNIEQRIRGIDWLLDDLADERSDFILEKAFQKLVGTNSARQVILSRIRELPRPITDEDFQELGRLNDEYKKLLQSFGEAIDELNQFLKRPQK